jgi:fatty acid desaturase
MENNTRDSNIAEDDDLTLEDFSKFALGVRLLFTLVTLALMLLTAYAGFNQWPWYIWIPLCAVGIFIIRVFRHSISIGLDRTEREIKLKTPPNATSETFESNTSAIKKTGISLEEFVEMAPRPTDEVKISKAYKRIEDKRNFTLRTLVIIGLPIMMIAGVFWYGLGLIIATIFSG